MTLEVVIQEFTDEDLRPLRELFASYFPEGDRLLTPEYSQWLYGANPFGKALMVKVLQERRWVGFMAMIPVTLSKAAETLRAYYVVNVLVHPDFHGKNLFGRMIMAAMARVDLDGSALLGHPNDMALKSWQRAQMHFHQQLRPSLVWPQPWARGLSASTVRIVDDLVASAGVLSDVAQETLSWSVAATPAYLDWRYLRHPSNVYVVQALTARGKPAGIQITKRVKAGVRLLVDQFVRARDIKAATGLLPPLTICFWPDAMVHEMSSAVWVLPWKKRIPFFFTRSLAPEASTNSSRLGLSASDF